MSVKLTIAEFIPPQVANNIETTLTPNSQPTSITQDTPHTTPE